MKMGIRKPSVTKSIKARTTGNFKRNVKKAVNPMYGKKGMGMIHNPKKAVYNKVYNKTTLSVSDLTKGTKSRTVHVNDVSQERVENLEFYENTSPTTWKVCGIIMKVLAIICAVVLGLPGLVAGMFPLFIIAVIATFGMWKLGSVWTKKAKEINTQSDTE